MDKTLYLNSSFETKALKKGSKSIKIAGYANTTAKDRSGDIVTAEAWAKGIDNYRRNPVLLYQHKHDCPIGRVDNIRVDKKGIFVEGLVSEAAEKNHGVQTLIKDGALKSFSVGFRVKDGKYNREDDSMMITEVELLEISVVSVPCNQDSLFSIRKSFDSDEEFNEFKKSLKEADAEEIKKMRKIKAGITDMSEGHYHTVEMDENGNGVTTYASHMQNHAHKVVGGVVLEAEGHSHDITMAGVPIHSMEEGEVVNERPLSPTEEEAMSNSKQDEVTETKADEVEAEVTEVEVEAKSEEATEEVTEAVEETAEEKSEEVTEEKAETEEVEVKAESSEEVTDIEKDDEEELEIRDPMASIPFTNLLSEDASKLQHGDLVNYQEKMFRVTNVATEQSPIFKFLEVDAEGEDCDNVVNVKTEEHSQVEKSTSEDAVTSESLTKELHENSDKEKDEMADQVVDTIDLTAAKPAEEIKKEAPRAEVSEPAVAELVQKTGEAIVKEADAADQQMLVKGDAPTAYTPRESEQVAELKAQMEKYQEEIAALQRSKMHYQEQSRNQAQYSEKEMANAVLVAKLLNKRDIFDTKYGAKMKAVTSVDQFLSNFSQNIYTEMEQQLVVAPMFNRMAVDAKTFRVPVADEDTDGDVAQFASGTFATGIADATNVPTSNQNTISSVDFTPHKFMATTHLAKDEEEDTVLPLLDFLRSAATRRLARAIDKAILRGTGALTGFTASPTNAITAGTGYASVIEGITNLTDDVGAGLTVDTGSANDKADPSDIASARTKLGKYGLQLGNDLVYLTSIEGYNNLVTTSDFQTVDKFGPNATYLTGSVGAVYGIPIAITEFLDNVGTQGNDIGVLLYKPGFMIAERRGIEIESEYEPRQQVTAMYMSTRIDFKALTTNSSSALDATKYSYAVTIEAGA
jgi:HK97 family phage prohead protease/HK97 family phage major capsid protein